MRVVAGVYEVKESAHIDAPPEVVWRAFTHIERWPEWGDSWIETSAPGGDPWRVGGRLRLVVKPWWRPLAIEPAVAEIDPPRTAIWVSNSGGVARQTTVHFDEDGEGIRAGISIRQEGPMQWTLPFFSPTWAVRRMLQEWLAGLKADAEASAA